MFDITDLIVDLLHRNFLTSSAVTINVNSVVRGFLLQIIENCLYACVLRGFLEVRKSRIALGMGV